MSDNQVFPDWLEIDIALLAEEISHAEVSLLQNCGKYQRLNHEKYSLLEANPNVYNMLDHGSPIALTVEESRVILQVNMLEQKMRTIRDEVVFLLGRKNAYMFMRSIGLA